MNLMNATVADPIVSVNTNAVDSSSSSSSSSWNVDSSRLVQLMMGGTASSSSSAAPHRLHSHNPTSENLQANRCTASGGETCTSNSIPAHNCNGSNPNSHDCCVDGIAKPRSSNDGDLGAFFFFFHGGGDDDDDDDRKNRALPSGWERCLDLKSGEIYMKKLEEVASTNANSNSTGGTHKNTITNIITRTQVGPYSSRQRQQVEKQDWLIHSSYSSPIQPTLLDTQNTYNIVTMNLFDNYNAVMSKSACSIARDSDFNNAFVDRQADETLCLDLDLSLANEKRSKVSYNGTKGAIDDTINPNSSLTNIGTSMNTSQGLHVMSPLTKDISIQHWKWQAGVHTNHDSKFHKPLINADIQEMVRLQTMITATCSHCLTRVLLKKSNPKCPRCSNPIILECANNLNKKRPYTSIDFSSNGFSLPTNSSQS